LADANALEEGTVAKIGRDDIGQLVTKRPLLQEFGRLIEERLHRVQQALATFGE
jgi:hypothetical protein